MSGAGTIRLGTESSLVREEGGFASGGIGALERGAESETMAGSECFEIFFFWISGVRLEQDGWVEMCLGGLWNKWAK